MDETPTTANPDGEESTTDSPAKRHRFTNDTLAFVLTLGFSAAVIADGAGFLSLAAVPETALLAWVVMVGTAVVWAFGSAALEAWRGK